MNGQQPGTPGFSPPSRSASKHAPLVDGTPDFVDGFALLVGATRMRHDSWSLPDASRDVESLASVLRESERFALEGEGQVLTLVNETATRANILESLRNLAERSGKKPQSTIIVYYTGHGWRDPDGGYSLVPYDVIPGETTNLLTARDLWKALQAFESERLLVVLDTCHAGGMASPRDRSEVAKQGTPMASPVPSPPTRQDLELLASRHGRAILASCRGDERSWMLDERRMSIFTWHLIEALSGVATSPDQPWVRLSHVIGYLSEAVPVTARLLGHRQTPCYNIDGEDFPIVVAQPRRTPHRTRVSLPSRAEIRGSLRDSPTSWLHLDELAEVVEAWGVLFRAALQSSTEPSAETRAPAHRALTAVIRHSASREADERVSFVLWRTLSSLVATGRSLETAVAGLELYLRLGLALNHSGDLSGSCKAYRTARRILRDAVDQGEPSHDLLRLQADLINREAVAMRDELQPMMALQHLAVYGDPRTVLALNDEGLFALGTKAQVLTYLGEVSNCDAESRLREAESLLREVIRQMKHRPQLLRELPREYNYLAAIHGASGSLERMDEAFDLALQYNSGWFEPLGEDASFKDRRCWVENNLFTFQLWLKYCEKGQDDERFERVEKKIRQFHDHHLLTLGDSELLREMEQRYPAALFDRYRALRWARRLSGPPKNHRLWDELVLGPLEAIKRHFHTRQTVDFLAAAVALDLLILCDTVTGSQARELLDLLNSLARSSQIHWANWGEDFGVGDDYREPFVEARDALRCFLSGRFGGQELKGHLEQARRCLGY